MAQFPCSALPPTLCPLMSLPPAAVCVITQCHKPAKEKIKEPRWEGRILCQADEVLIFCKCCLCQRQHDKRGKNKRRKGEGEWLISNRNKILRKQACCQPELALPYCLAMGVCTLYTLMCMCSCVCACVNLFLLMYPVNQCVHSFICCLFSEPINSPHSLFFPLSCKLRGWTKNQKHLSI